MQIINLYVMIKIQNFGKSQRVASLNFIYFSNFYTYYTAVKYFEKLRTFNMTQLCYFYNVAFEIPQDYNLILMPMRAYKDCECDP